MTHKVRSTPDSFTVESTIYFGPLKTLLSNPSLHYIVQPMTFLIFEHTVSRDTEVEERYYGAPTICN